MKTFNWKGIRADVEFVGYSTPPWGRGGETRPTYHVEISSAGTNPYRTKAWGPAMDPRGIADEDRNAEMAALVIDELASAAADPDEFWAMAVGEGRPSREQVRGIEAVLDAGEAFGDPIIEAAEYLREQTDLL